MPLARKGDPRGERLKVEGEREHEHTAESHAAAGTQLTRSLRVLLASTIVDELASLTSSFLRLIGPANVRVVLQKRVNGSPECEVKAMPASENAELPVSALITNVFAAARAFGVPTPTKSPPRTASIPQRDLLVRDPTDCAPRSAANLLTHFSPVPGPLFSRVLMCKGNRTGDCVDTRQETQG
jgi:hypothetical protein